MYTWQIQTVDLPLKFKWTISRGSSVEKKLFFVQVSDGKHHGMGEVAGITSDDVKFQALLDSFKDFKVKPSQTIEEIVGRNLPSHLSFGLTSALTHMQAQKNKQNLFEYLNIPDPTPIRTSFSLPILSGEEVKIFFQEYNLSRFPVLKIKISKEHPLESCLALGEIYSGPIRIDANEAFNDHIEVLDFIEEIKPLNIEFIEQPLPRNLWDEHKKLKQTSSLPVIADESVQDKELPMDFKEAFHGVNVKLMKAGSYQRALRQIKQAKDWGLKTMLGCMVESSLGIAGAMAIGSQVDYFDLDGFLYFQNEPHNIVSENNGHLTFQKSHPLFSN